MMDGMVVHLPKGRFKFLVHLGGASFCPQLMYFHFLFCCMACCLTTSARISHAATICTSSQNPSLVVTLKFP